MQRAVGARVTKVYRSRQRTPAELAGVRPDDVIVNFNGVTVIDENHLINLVSLADIGRSVQIEVYRAGRRQSLQLKLTDREHYQTASDASGSFQTR